MTQTVFSTHQGLTLQLEYDDRVYQPGELSWAMCDLMEIHPGDRVIDVGCGTGCLGLFAALLGAGEVICTDPIPKALEWTRHNAALNGLGNVDVRRGSELEAVTGEDADLILTLPPQMPFHANFNPWRYGGVDGCDVILRLLDQAVPILQSRHGRMYLVHAALANPQRVRTVLDQTSRSWEIVKTMEKELNPAETAQLHPGLYDYLLDADRQGLAELEHHEGRYTYPVWFYHVRY